MLSLMLKVLIIPRLRSMIITLSNVEMIIFFCIDPFCIISVCPPDSQCRAEKKNGGTPVRVRY
jgi:hypothetical protein